MRHEDLEISNLETEEQVQEIKDIICGITGARFVSADLDTQVVEFDMFQDFDNLDLTDIQCRLREHGYEAGEVTGTTCRVRFQGE